MAFSIPTLTKLREDVRNDMNAALPGADSRLAQGVLRVVGDVLAFLAFGLYGYLRWQYRQLFTDTADEDALVRDGEMRGVFRNAADFAHGLIDVTGTNGKVIPVDKELATKGGAIFTVTAEATIALGIASVAVKAASAGAAGNLDAGTVLSFTEASDGVNAAATVGVDGFSGGADQEDLEAYRLRVLDHKRQPPQGGSAHDYEAWAKEVAGVTRAWASPREMGIGTVTLRFMMDDVRDANSGLPQGTTASPYDAGTGDQAAVYAYIDDVHPVIADLYVCAPVPVALDITITNLDLATDAVKAAIMAELLDMLRRDSEPGGTIYRSRISEAISIAAGEGHHELTLPAADVPHGTGEIAVLGDVTYA